MSLRGYAILSGLAIGFIVAWVVLGFASVHARSDEADAYGIALAIAGGVVLVLIGFAVVVTVGTVVLRALAARHPRKVLED